MAGASLNRYHRQTLLPEIGPAGQARLAASRVLLIGCGALGCAIAEQLVRAGIGALVIIDRDLVELTNLQRQVLFDESDAAAQSPKAMAAADRLRRINSGVVFDPRVAHVDAWNIESLAGLETAQPVGLIVDGTDNVATRYLINDVSIKHGIPWVYGGCVGMEGRVLAIQPGRTRCLRCLYPDPPTAAHLPTCDTAGVLGAAVMMTASLQVAVAMQLLTGNVAFLSEGFIHFNIWNAQFRAVNAIRQPDDPCPCCGDRMFPFLDQPATESSILLCGRNTVQIRPSRSVSIDLASFETRWKTLGDLERTAFLLRCRLHEPREIQLTLFTDGRLLVHGTIDSDRAKSMYARFVGN